MIVSWFPASASSAGEGLPRRWPTQRRSREQGPEHADANARLKANLPEARATLGTLWKASLTMKRLSHLPGGPLNEQAARGERTLPPDSANSRCLRQWL